MRPRHSSRSFRGVFAWGKIVAFLCTLAALGALPLIARAPQSEPSQPGAVGMRIWLRDAQAIAVNHVGSAKSMQAIASAEPLALAEGDFDADGMQDLVVGYASANGGILAFHRGNLDAFAPQSEESFQAIGRGDFPSPFLPTAVLIDLPVRPDFVTVGSFNGNSFPDVVVAQRGDSSIYLLANDGRGNLGTPKATKVGGPVTALASGDFGPRGTYSKLLVGIGDRSNSHLMVYTGTQTGLGGLGVLPLHAPASNIVFGDFGAGSDAVFVSGGQVVILHSSSMRLETLSLPVTVRSIAVGSFIWDRNPQLQIAVLGSDGSVHIAAHNEFDPRAYTAEELQLIAHSQRGRQRNPVANAQTVPVNGWKIVESVPDVANSGEAVLLRTRISDHGADDVMVLDPARQKLTVIAHPDLVPGATNFTPSEISSRPYTGSPKAAIAMRTTVDGRPGVVAIHQGQVVPLLMMPLPDPTFTVNTTNDTLNPGACAAAAPNECSLREAVVEANATAGTDTIMLPAGTYTLTIPRAATPLYDAKTGTLNVNDSLNIIGAGQNTTIIQAGTSTAVGVDMVMAVNEDINSITNATASISNLTLQNGHNRGAHGVDGDGGCMEFDTGTNGTATLTLTNVTLQNCTTTQGSGGGLANFNFEVPTGSGHATISNSIIQGNSVADNSGGSATAAGGGIWVSDSSQMIMTNSQVLNNLAIQDTATTGIGQAGGLFIVSVGTPGQTPQTQIHSSTISGNTASFAGGGISDSGNLLIDQGTIISGNTNGHGASGTHTSNGGGLFANPSGGLSVTLNNVTITNNTSTGTGGGIATGAGGSTGTVNISFSRLAGNSAGATGSNLENLGSADTVTNNWWGTNDAGTTISPSTSTCPATFTHTCFDPFIVLTHTASPSTIKINGSSTLTADMSKDNHGNGAILAISTSGVPNLSQIFGLAVTFDNPVLGTIPQAQPETLGNPTPTATATFNAGNTAGLGSANATVDQAVVPVNSNLIASASESGTIVTITTVGAHGFSTGDFVSISGVEVSGYNGQFFAVTGTPSATTFTYTASTSGLASSSGGTATEGIIILEPPSITKSFNPTTVAVSTSSVSAPSTVTFSITNGNVVPINASFTDSLPSGLVVATTPTLVNGCGGTVTATAGSGSISFSNSSLAVDTCTVSVNVQSAVDNTYNNSVTIDSSDAGNGNTSMATLIVINPPSITKTFGATSIPLNGTTSLSFSVNNSNTNSTFNGVVFNDSLPVGLVTATPSNLSSTCSGTVTGAGGSSSVSLTGASLVAGASCTVSANVTGTTAGTKNNSVQVSSTNGGTGNTSNASLTVIAPPTITQVDSLKGSVPLNSVDTLQFTITNPNPTPITLTGIGFTDTLSSGLAVAAGADDLNCGGTLTAVAGTQTFSLSGVTIAGGANCSVEVNVTGTAAGNQTSMSSAVTSTEGGSGNTTSATINVVAPPVIAKAFNPSSISLNATSLLNFTITDPSPNTVAELGVAFADTLPTGLTVASGTTPVCGGTLTTTAPTGIALTGAGIGVGTPCMFSVTVTGASSGSFTNVTGNVSSTNGGTGNSASAGLTVASPPSMTKSFGALAIPLNGTTSMTFNITNPNSGLALSGVQFTDSLPAGLVVSSSAVTNTCGGAATVGSGGGTLSLSGGSIATGGSCSVSATVQGTSAGMKTNAATVSSSNAGTGNTPTATITVVAPPTLSKSFGASSIPLNGTTSLSFTIANPNGTVGLTGVGFSDILPTGLVVASPSGLSSNCGGTAAASGGAIGLSGGSLAASGSCMFSVNVTGTTAGVKNNSTSAVTSNEGGTGLTASASITVVAPPSITKAFGTSTVAVGGTTSLTLTIANPNTAAALTGVAVTDNFPSGLVVASAASTTCGGTATGAVGANGLSLSGGSIAAGGSCILTANVMPTTAGPKVNTTGNVSSTNGGTGNTATATLEAGDFSVSLSPTTETIPPGHMASFTLTVSSTTGFTSTINLTGSGGPPGSTLTIKPSSVTLLSGSEMAKVTIDLAVPKGASKGTSTITVTGASDGLTHTATATLKVGLND